MTHVFEFCTLVCHSGTSNKVYHLALTSDGPGTGFQTVGLWGGIGRSLQKTEITTKGVSYELALDKYTKMRDTKMRDTKLKQYEDIAASQWPGSHEFAGWQRERSSPKPFARTSPSAPQKRTIDPGSMRTEALHGDLRASLQRVEREGFALPHDSVLVLGELIAGSPSVTNLSRRAPTQAEHALLCTLIRRAAAGTSTRIVAMCVDDGLLLLHASVSIDDVLMPIAVRTKMRVGDGRTALRGLVKNVIDEAIVAGKPIVALNPPDFQPQLIDTRLFAGNLAAYAYHDPAIPNSTTDKGINAA